MGKDGTCTNHAIALWVCGDETWDTCMECQENDFNGWPEGMEPGMTDLAIEYDGVRCHACSASSHRIPANFCCWCGTRLESYAHGYISGCTL